MTLLTRWTPLNDTMARNVPLREMSRLVDEFLRPDMPVGMYPPADISETGDAYTVTVEIPGLKKDDIKLNVEDNVLALRLTKQEHHEEKGRSNRRVERIYGTFERHFPFATSIDANAVKATYKDGLLEIVLPKAESSRARSIEVEVK